MAGLPSCRSSFNFRQITLRLIFFAGVWLVLSYGDTHSWPFGIPTILLAVWISLQLASPQRNILRLLVLVRYLPFFLYKSLVSGVDVMLRVLHPRLPIDPGLVEYPLTIPHQAGRIFLANSISLLPGTISARLVDNLLIVHVLDKGLPVLATIKDLEQRVAALYVFASSIDQESRVP